MMKRTPPVLLAIPAMLAACQMASGAVVNSVANGAYADGTTWSDGNPPSALNDYQIGHTVESYTAGTYNVVGASVSVEPGGLWHLTAHANGNRIYNADSVILNGGRLRPRSSNQYARVIFINAPIAVNAASILEIGDGGEQFNMTVNLTDSLSGSSDLELRGNTGNGADDTAWLYVQAADNTFSGDWTVNSVDSGQVILMADAANTLGSGMVTLQTRGQLEVTAANGLDSITGVTLTEASSVLTLTNAWTSAIATLDVQDGTVDLVDSTSSVATMTIVGNTVPIGGPYTATDLTNLGFGGTYSGATGTITVTGLPNPTMVVPPAFAFVNSGLSANYAVGISNTPGDGSTALNISGVVATGTDSSDVSNIVIPGGIAANSSDDVTFDFAPSHGSGTYTFDLEITSDDAAYASPRTISVTIEVLPSPVLTVASSFSFTNNGALANYVIPITNDANDGTTGLAISLVEATGVDAPDVSNLSYPASVAAGTGDNITFDFEPGFGAGEYTFNIEISSDDESAGSPRIVAVTIDVQDPVIALGTTALDFGKLDPSPGPQTAVVTITNNGGTEDLVIDEFLTEISGSTEFSVTSFPAPIAPGASGELEITFDPGSAAGLFSGTLTVHSNDSDGATPTVSLSAFVFPAGLLVAADFGTPFSPIEADYHQVIAGEGVSTTIEGVTLTLESANANTSSFTSAPAGDDLTTDGAAATGANATLSVLISGLDTGTLNLISHHNVNSPASYAVPIDVEFGEQGGSLTMLSDNGARPLAVQALSLAVVSGTTYELKITQQNNLSWAYLSGLMLWGDAVPGGTNPPPPYSTFVTNAGLDPLTTGAAGLDPDGDGVDTGIEWVVGGYPNDLDDPDTNLLPTSSIENIEGTDYLVFRYRRMDAAATDPNTTIQTVYGSTLAGWTEAVDGVDGVIVVETDNGAGVNVDLVEVYIPATLAVDGKLFARLDVVIATP